MITYLFIIAVIIIALMTLRHYLDLEHFRENLWVGQHVDLYLRYTGFISVIITDLQEDFVTVKGLSGTFYDTTRKHIYPKE